MRHRNLAVAVFVLLSFACNKGGGSGSSGSPDPSAPGNPDAPADSSNPTGTIQLGSVDAIVLSDTDGVVTAQLKLDETSIQVVNASKVALIVGSSLELPPDAIPGAAKAAKITLQTGAPVATGAVAIALGIENPAQIKAVGASVLMEAIPSFDAPEAAPFTLKLPIPEGAALAEVNYGVMYRIRIAAEGDRVVDGVIPSTDVAVEGGKIVVKVRYFGAYQVFTAPKAVAAVAQVTASGAILPAKFLEDNPLVPASTLKTARVANGADVRGGAGSSTFLSWTAATAGQVKIASYDVSVFDAAACAGAGVLTNVAATVTARTVSGLADGDVRSFRVVAHDDVGRSADSGCSGAFKIDTVPPPGLSNFTGIQGVDPSTVRFNLIFQPDTTDISAVEIRRKVGATPPVDCNDGVAGTVVSQIADGDVDDYTGMSGQTFSYLACTVDAAGNKGSGLAVNSVVSGTTRSFTRGGTSDANYGGLAGADALCTAEAVADGLTQSKWKALLSTTTINARDRLVIQGPITNFRGSPDIIATSRADLWSGTPSIPTSSMNYTAMGTDTAQYYVYTGSDKYGRVKGTLTCGDWTNNTGAAPDGSVGVSLSSGAGALEYGSPSFGCGISLSRLYCMAQPPDLAAFPAFAVTTGAAAGSVAVTFTAQATRGVVDKYKLYRAAGSVAPRCDDFYGAAVTTFNVGAVNFAYTDATATPSGGTFTYLLCAVDTFDNVLATATATTISK